LILSDEEFVELIVGLMFLAYEEVKFYFELGINV
jgi:hypothetical protein